MLDLSKGCANKYPLHGIYLFQIVGDDGLAICDHDFDEAINVNIVNGQALSGFLLQYHCYEPWKEGDWVIANLVELIELLESSLSQVVCESFSSDKCLLLVNYLKSAVKGNKDVSMRSEWGGV